MKKKSTLSWSLQGAIGDALIQRNKINSGLLRFARNDAGGNALIFILIAIALLGLLTVTLSRSGDSSNDTGSFEQNQIAASEILSYAKSIENAVQSLLARGCGENEISFENNVVAGYTNTTPSPADKSCHVFDVAGAGMTYIPPDETWLENSFEATFPGNYGTWRMNAILQVEGVETDRTDLWIALNFMDKDVCLALNNMMGVTNPSGNPPLEVNTTVTGVFKGSYSAPSPDNVGDDGGHNLPGKRTFCRETATSSLYQFIHILHAR